MQGNMNGAKSYLRMKSATASEAASNLIGSDFKEIGDATMKLANHVIALGSVGGFTTTFLQWLASAAAIYLLILDRTNWRSNMLTSLLVPYIFLSLPDFIFGFFSGEVGKWITFIGVILRLFFTSHYRDWFEMPGSLLLLLVIAPSFFANTVRTGWIGVLICLVIGCYLLQDHIRASGGFRNAFTKPNGISNTIGIILLFAYPVWALIGFI